MGEAHSAGAFTIAPDHPSLPGHFPGRPVVPGVVLLDRVLEAILPLHPGRRASGLPQVKFLRPVLPGQTVAVQSGAALDGRVAFACCVDGVEVARGTVMLG